LNALKPLSLAVFLLFVFVFCLHPSQLLSCISLLAVIVSGFFCLGVFLTPAKKKAPSKTEAPIPTTIAQILSRISPEQFELFCAALIIGMGQGYSFHEHCGGAGDKGIDAKLLNLHNNIVAVQAKHFAQDHKVEPSDVRDFIGAVTTSHAVYGFFVTTSTFTDAATQAAYGSFSRVRTIDGPEIERILQRRARDVALAYQDIQAKI